MKVILDRGDGTGPQEISTGEPKTTTYRITLDISLLEGSIEDIAKKFIINLLPGESISVIDSQQMVNQYSYSVGDKRLWWPGTSDYPSEIVLLKKLRDHMWLVNYSEDRLPNHWTISETELGRHGA